MKNSKAAVRYAISLLDLATEKSAAEAVLADMKSLKLSIEGSQELDMFLSNPTVKGEKKAEILKTVFAGKLNDITIDFLSLVTVKNRADILLAIANSFEEEYRKANNIVKLFVESAVKLDKTSIDAISAKLAPTGATVEIEESINPDLIGGFVARIGDNQIDNSILSSLKRLKTEFQSK